MKFLLLCFALCLVAVAIQATTTTPVIEEEESRLGELQMRRQLAVKKQTMQFRMVNEPTMCAAGKSSWVEASGAGPLHLEPCRNNRGAKNANTIFTVLQSATNPGMRTIRRTNKNKKNFCLHNFGGEYSVLSMVNPCVSGADQNWNLQDLLTLKRVSWTGAAEMCWDTLGNYFLNTRIALAPCDQSSRSQRFQRVLA